MLGRGCPQVRRPCGQPHRTVGGTRHARRMNRHPTARPAPLPHTARRGGSGPAGTPADRTRAADAVEDAERAEPSELGGHSEHAEPVKPDGPVRAADRPSSARADAAALPRTLRLPPHRALLQRGPSSRLLGLDPGTALVVDDLSPPLARMLDELVAPADRDGLIARAVRRGADAGAADGLLCRLVEAGALVDAAERERAARRRAEAVVTVSGTGPLAVGVAAGLALAGVGAVHTAPTTAPTTASVTASTTVHQGHGDRLPGLRARPGHRPGGRRPRAPARRRSPGRRAAGRAGCPRRTRSAASPSRPVRSRRRRSTRPGADRRAAPHARRAPASSAA